jgi:3-oxoacyl-[acyl-carrier-protein] synthase-1/3-oxoacyl-[acyl-carrier-protein] synthase II
MTITNACTSGADAIGLALDMIRSGQCECVVCGGADALSLVPHTGFARLMVYDSEPCRPFDQTRKGLNLGEGAAALVLESAEHARRRNAAVLGHILGYGGAADAYHFTAPHPEGRGLAASIRIAFENADLNASDMAFVNAHGTATLENDKVEGRVLATLLPATPVWASKGGTGHTLGAAGAVEAALSLQALNRRRVPASLGFQTPDPEIGLIPTRESLAVDSPYALSTSLGFGGGNAALVLGRGEI